jgi:tetratricopeptide (TPR) repeat protein
MRKIRENLRACGTAWVFLCSVALLDLSAAAPPEQLLEEAVQEYRAALDGADRDQRLERFRRAELLFARLIDGDQEDSSGMFRNADLYVNLGNAAMGAEHLGRAILAYRRALQLDPDHRRARQNLEHARTLLPNWVPRPEEGGLLDTFFFWSRRLSTGELQTLAAGMFLIAAALVACSIRWSQPLLRNLAAIPGIAWLLLLGLMLFRWSGNDGEAAVVVVPEIIARSADSAGAPPRLPQALPSGTEVQVIETRDQWTRIRLFDGRDAWLPGSALEIVSSQRTLHALQ